MKKIWEELKTDLTREKIISCATMNNEKPYGYIFDYIKDVYPEINLVQRAHLTVALCVKLGVQFFGDYPMVMKFKDMNYGEIVDYVYDPAIQETMIVPCGWQYSPMSGLAFSWADPDLKEIPMEVAELSMAVAEVYPLKPTAKTKTDEDVFLKILPKENGDYAVLAYEDSDNTKMVESFIIHSGNDGDIPDCDCTDYAKVINLARKRVWDTIDL